ncbi:hypothetical protein SDC9_140966 [bioreactor metagenome]|uniref:Uncharacterized protein n=1 Tax=bioreactor metagenome TaxID=1076179 RepID=A0A645DWC2_9ZZZZ
MGHIGSRFLRRIRARDHRHVSACMAIVRNLFRPHHLVFGACHLGVGGHIQPDLEQLEFIGLVLVQQREHLGMLQACTRRHPLHVARAIAPAVALRIGVIDIATTQYRHRLHAAMRMVGKAWQSMRAEVEAEAVRIRKVVADAVPLQALIGHAEFGIARRVVLDVMRAQEERVHSHPGPGQFHGFEDGIAADGMDHVLTFHCIFNRASVNARGHENGP